MPTVPAELQQDETVAEETVAVDTLLESASSQGLGDKKTDATTTLEEVRGAGLPSHPGWLFSEETLQLAAAHDIRSAVVDVREVLLPRPKQRPGVAGQKVGMAAALRTEQPSHPPLDPGMAVPGKDASPSSLAQQCCHETLTLAWMEIRATCHQPQCYGATLAHIAFCHQPQAPLEL